MIQEIEGAWQQMTDTTDLYEQESSGSAGDGTIETL